MSRETVAVIVIILVVAIDAYLLLVQQYEISKGGYK